VTTVSENPPNGKKRKPPRPAKKSPKLRAGSGVPDLLCYPHTGTGNAERLVAIFGDRIRYCVEWKTWLIWDGTRWKPDRSREIQRLAKYTIRMFYAMTARITSPSQQKETQSYARLSESAKSIRAMLACAESEKGITVSAGEFDRDP